MQTTDKRGFRDALYAVFELYQKSRPSDPTVMMYWGALRNIPTLDDFMAAINLHVADPDQGQFLPKPADILRNITGNRATQAEMAWTKADRALRCAGPANTVVFDDSLIHAVIADMGGWVQFCDVDDKEYPFRHNEFVKRYSGYINKPPADIPPKLIGTDEAYNKQHGFLNHMPAPMLIGDAEKAKFVLENNHGQGRVGIQQMESATQQIINKVLKVEDKKDG